MAGIEFKNPHTPFSPQYDDFYFAHDRGVEESHYLYIEGTKFIESVQSKKAKITVAEIGFGVGLNFLLTLKSFQEHASPGQRLEYWSVEKHPVSLPDLRKLYQAYPHLLPTAEILFRHYPLLTPGVHRVQLKSERVTLNLVIGDALLSFQNLAFQADHWYWDGFSPQKNPDAYSEPLFREVARLSAPGSRGASFTAAGFFKRTLTTLGFKLNPRAGFGTKRESIQAQHEGPAHADREDAWFSRANLQTLKPSDTIAVLGAGLAGSAIARALAERGFSVHVFDSNGIAHRASSNSVALFNVQLSKLPNPISRFSQAALSHFLSELKELGIPKALGILRKGLGGIESLKSSAYPDDFYEVRNESLFFPHCGIINPRTLCDARLQHSNIQMREHAVAKVTRSGDRLTLQFADGSDAISVDHVIYALGADLSLGESKLEESLVSPLPVRPIRGQTLLVRPTILSRDLAHTLIDEGYASPLANEVTGHDFHLIGATYQAKNISVDQESLDTDKLLLEAQSKWPEFEALTPADVVSTKEGYRASTPDKLPLIGPLCNPGLIEQHYAHALKGAKPTHLPLLEAEKAQWLIMGLGSRGVTYSSLAAEILVAFMCGDALPIEADLVPHFHPARFYLRNLRKKPSSVIL